MSEPSLATLTSVSMLTEKDVGGADHNSPWPGVCNQSANYKALQWQALHISSQTVKCEEKKKPFPSQSYPATGATALAGVKHQQRFSLQTCLVSRQRTHTLGSLLLHQLHRTQRLPTCGLDKMEQKEGPVYL